ncbi:MAG: HSP90 family protein [Propioniciclava sp.]
MTVSEQKFQVDLRGVVDLLSRHIYSNPRVYLRELLQNAVDALTARRELDGHAGSIRITPVSDTSEEFVITDDGVGLTAEQVGDVLATVGRSSKRDILDLPRQGYLGQFGIGLLACFMVADEIVIHSRSAHGGDPVAWVGRTDGTFATTVGDPATPMGTSVHLRPRHDERALLSNPMVASLAEMYGEFLPVPIRVDTAGGTEVHLTRSAPFTRDADIDAVVGYGADLLGQVPLDVIRFDIAGTGTSGAAYVLPTAPPPGVRQRTRAYLGRMLLSERADAVLPEWAFFVRAVLDTSLLSPTASREGFVEDEALTHTREQIGAAIRRWIRGLSLTAPHRLAEFVRTHEVGLKSLVIHDDELAEIVLPWLTVDTTEGRLTLGQLADRGTIRYAETVDEYRQVAGILDRDQLLVNGGYLYDAELIRRFSQLNAQVTAVPVDVIEALDRLDPPPLDDREAAVRFEERATAALAATGCVVVTRSIADPSLPAVYVANPETLRVLDRRRTKTVSTPLWSGVLGRIDELAPERHERPATELSARLCVNWLSPVVRTLAGTAATERFQATLQLLYIQALLAGHQPLGSVERAMFTHALGQVLTQPQREGDSS